MEVFTISVIQTIFEFVLDKYYIGWRILSWIHQIHARSTHPGLQGTDEPDYIICGRLKCLRFRCLRDARVASIFRRPSECDSFENREGFASPGESQNAPNGSSRKARLWLFFSPFFFPPKKEKRRMNSKNRDFRSCLSARFQNTKNIGASYI